MSFFAQLLNGQTNREIGQIIKNLLQKQINKDLTSTDIVDTENKAPVKLSLTKNIALTTDIGQQALFEIADLYTPKYPTAEPHGDLMALWLKFENAGRMRDYSLAQDVLLAKDVRNEAFAVGLYNLPGLFPLENDNHFMKSELFSYYNGATHFAYVINKLMIQLKRICIDQGKDITFFLRFKPMSLGRQIDREATTIFTKVDDDQLRYGYALTIDTKGHMHFYIRKDYRQYHLWIKDAYSSIYSDPVYQQKGGFSLESFNDKSFQTDYQYLCSVVKSPLLYLDDWHFEYDPTDNKMETIFNGLLYNSSTNFPSVKPYLSLPMQEGKWIHTSIAQQTTIYDNSGNNNNGTISGLSTGGLWNDDNTLASLGSNVGGTGDGMAIDFGSIAALNSLTEFSIAFWYNPQTEIVNGKSYNTRLITKGYAAANTIYIERRTGVNDLKFSIRAADNIEQSVTFTNPFPDTNKWYFITCKWKSGEKLKISVNNTQVESASNITATIAGSDTLKIFNSTRAPIGIMALLKIYNTQINSTTQGELWDQGYHNPSFPKSESIQPNSEEEPDPVFIPYSVFYIIGKQTTPNSGSYRYINALAGDNPFVELYSCADGTSSSDPETAIYDINDGQTTGGGVTSFTQEYNCPDPGTNSFVQLSESDDNAAAAVEVSASNSALIGKKITKARFHLRAESTPTGNIRCKVWNASNVVVTTLWFAGVLNQTLSAASVEDSDYEWYEFINTDITPYGANTLQIGWKVGIEYDDGASESDQINVQRDTANPKSGEKQASRDYSGSWSSNTSNDIVAELYSGGTGTAVVEPYLNLQYHASSPYDRIMQRFGTGDSCLNQIPTKVKFKLKRTGTMNGQIIVELVTTYNGTLKATFDSAINAADVPTTLTEFTFSNSLNTEPIISGYVIRVRWFGFTSASTGTIGVLMNNGASPADPHNGNNSYAQRYGQLTLTSYNSGSTSYDLSGKIYKGGTSFDPWNRFSETKQHIGLKVVNINSSLHGDKVTKVVPRMKKTGTPTGIITCSIKDGITFADKVVIGTFDVSTMTAGVLQDVPFTKSTNTYLLAENDRIAFSYSGADGSNYVEINVNQNIKDGLNTIMYDVNGPETYELAVEDLAGKIYTGGEPDQNSRVRVVQSIEHQNSIIRTKKITKVIAHLIRANTSTTGTVYCSLYRGSDNQLIKTLGEYSVGLLSTDPANPTAVTFDDANNYPMAVGDKIAIEFNGGTSTNRVGVLVRQLSPNYDGTNSHIRKYDEVDYDDSEPLFDLVGEMYEGGFLYTPPEGVEPDPTPVNDKDCIICAGNNKTSGFFEALMGEFRIYKKLITPDEATNLYNNRCSISQLGGSEILTPFTIKPVGMDG